MAGAAIFPVQQFEIECLLNTLPPKAPHFSMQPPSHILRKDPERNTLDSPTLQSEVEKLPGNCVKSKGAVRRRVQLSGEGELKTGVVGGVMANLLKLCVRGKFQSCGKLNVVIGGNSFQLLLGYSTGFRVHIHNFVFEGCSVTEAEAHTLLRPGQEVQFNLNAARMGAKLFSRRVLTKMSMRLRESDGTFSLQRGGNFLLRETVEHFWNLKMGQSQTHKEPPPMPAFRVRFQGGLALFEEVLEGSATEGFPPLRLALKFSIEKTKGGSHLLVTESPWPQEPALPEQGARLAPPAQKVVELPSDVNFVSLSLEQGWMEFSYTFELDL